MREILFRGKTGYDEWIYGMPVANTKGVITHITYCKKEFFEELGEVIPHEVMEKIISKTLGQYTGFEIKKAMLFEHDIVRYRETSLDEWEYGVVAWCGDRDYPAFDLEPWIDCDCNSLSYIMATCEAEIIGNTHDNPELLGEK